ncbi:MULTISPECIES: Na(+)/H(+) antiporter subunit C [Staphylococcus]|uniref:Na(+)/H(+) antiporter subunit C n=2 Tax=Staphylococcus TaxID=1279 RepID=A0A2T4S5B2_9STAP|nr:MULTISPECIES: Na(+)/H(+) antiporter subunit C [Staphylococcus]AMG97445.1 Na(+)/H(+) antiporter subunit C [Staphylococcus simulans]ATF30279.1 Na(+)/H(+) antiporter subunit C [Staphylococcus simulans]AVO01164.1 Na(+)/H(+) antiporter subunit C [Staphylococcus simulans]AVO04116.1 Na(+)/H(+) antiporter subunit C [Staphylococcus simulans]AWG17712.1 Na(+)/H(+) antiporter subunit C [Staphylococcus simulans]
MNVILIIIIGILTFAGTYMILSKNLIRIVLGTAIYTHVANLVILAMSGFDGTKVPIINDEGSNYVDPLPQALILTAIVIGFAVSAFLLVLVYRTYKVTRVNRIEALRGEDDDVDE